MNLEFVCKSYSDENINVEFLVKDDREVALLHRYIREKDEEIKNFSTLILNEKRELESIQNRNDEIKTQILAYKSILDG